MRSCYLAKVRGFTDVMRSLISCLGINQKGDYPGWVWPNEVNLLKMYSGDESITAAEMLSPPSVIPDPAAQLSQFPHFMALETPGESSCTQKEGTKAKKGMQREKNESKGGMASLYLHWLRGSKLPRGVQLHETELCQPARVLAVRPQPQLSPSLQLPEPRSMPVWHSEKAGISTFILHPSLCCLNLWVTKFLLSPVALHVGSLIIKKNFAHDLRLMQPAPLAETHLP